MVISKRSTIIIAVSVITVPVLLFAAWVWITLHWSFSEGERAGFLQKFSKRGWVCKSWEGELVLVSVPGAIPEKFLFTVRDDKVAKQLMDATGKRVILTYAQHTNVPLSCFGDTEYFIEKVVVTG